MTKEWGMPTVDEVKTQGEAREIAMNWQYFASQASLSYEELAVYSAYFEALGEKLDLMDEFEENGII